MFRSTAEACGRVAAALALMAVAPSAPALETLLFEHFEDAAGDLAAGWEFAGAAGADIDDVAGSRALRVGAGASVVVSAEATEEVRIGAAFVASALGADAACITEASVDGGKSWFTVLRVIRGQDDGATRHAAAAWRALAPGTRAVRVRAWQSGHAPAARCWLDHLSVLARPRAAAVPAPRRLAPEDFLAAGDGPPQPVDMAAFGPPPDAAPPTATMSGRIELAVDAATALLEIVHDPWGRVPEIGEPIGKLPAFAIEIVQRGEDLVPLAQGLIRGAHPYWEIAFQPGRVWQEKGDGGWTRAALPFVLQEKSANCTHNGVLTWLFDADGRVTRGLYQVAGETCGYFKADLRGSVGLVYEARDLAAAAAPWIARLDRHRQARLPVRPLASLADDFPGLDPAGFAVDDGIDPREVSVLGLVAGGVHYRSECRTRSGVFPFCDSLPLPSYSTAKSVFAGIAVMRLEKLFPGVAERPIAGLLERCDRRRWADVTIENALDMATGNFRSLDFEEDEFSRPHEWFVFADTHRDKLSFACHFFPRKAAPGTRFVYHTSDTYVLGAALTHFVAQQTDGAELYRDVLREPLWRPLRLSPLLDQPLRTYDAVRQPYTGYGLTYEADDILRIAAWLMDGAKIEGRAMLDGQLLAAALQRDPADRGLPARGPGLRYNNGFWGFDAGPSLGCARAVWVPFMSGVSGITVAMFPNGVIYYYFSDSYVFRWQSAREAAHRIAPLC